MCLLLQLSYGNDGGNNDYFRGQRQSLTSTIDDPLLSARSTVVFGSAKHLAASTLHSNGSSSPADHSAVASASVSSEDPGSINIIISAANSQ